MTPRLGGIWNYLGREVAVPGASSGSNEGGGYQIPAQQLGALASSDAEIQKLIDAGIISRRLVSEARSGSNEGGGYELPAQYAYDVNTAKLPGTRFGSLMDVVQMDTPSGQGVGGFKLRDPNLKYEDPNYGWITPRSNTIDPSKQRNFYDMIGPLVMGAVLGGAGLGAFGPVGAGQGFAASAARGVVGGLTSGNYGGSIGSILGGASGVPGGSTLGSYAGSMLMPQQQVPRPAQQPQTLTPQQQAYLAQVLFGRG